MEQHPDEPRFDGAPAEAAAAADAAGFDPASLPLPWEAPAPEDPDAPRQRHDAFTEARKAVFLTALVKTGCVLDACRAVGVAARTVYLHQEKDPLFSEHCRTALRMSATPLELSAWSRAVEGVEQEFACGGQVHVRRRYDSGLLRLLLQGSNPKKYGPRPGFTRKRLLKHERKEIEREVRAKVEARHSEPPIEQVTESIIRKANAIKRQRDAELLAAGWTQTEDGHMIPPGYGRIAPLEDPIEAEPPGGSM